MSSRKKIETENTEEPVCPFCGQTEEDWKDDSPTEEGDQDVVVCIGCKELYQYTVSVSYRFNSVKMKDAQFRTSLPCVHCIHWKTRCVESGMIIICGAGIEVGNPDSDDWCINFKDSRKEKQ